MRSMSSLSSMSSYEDDDLSNLSWLQENNLLQIWGQNSFLCPFAQDQDIKTVSPSPPPSVVKPVRADRKEIVNNLNSPKDTNGTDTVVPCAVPPVTYNPRVHVHTKPPYSFSSLIFMAIESSPTKALPVKDIYTWILDNFPYYQTAPDGWKNTVRHNLSLNKCFQKVEKANGNKKVSSNDSNDNLSGKGSLWSVDPFLRPNLLQAVKKIPAHIYPYMSTAKTGQNFLQISDTFVTSTSDSPGSSSNSDSSLCNLPSTISSVNLLNDANPNDLTLDEVNAYENGDQTSGKVITIDKNAQNKLLPLLSKRVLIPIAKVDREPDEADVAESMLTLTQCNESNINNGNIYIITNKSQIAEDGTIPLVPVNFNPNTEHNYFSKDDDQPCDQIVDDVPVPDFTIQPEEQIIEGETISEMPIKMDRKSMRCKATNSTDDNDDDGLKCAEALYNLANAGAIKVSVVSNTEKSVPKTRSKSKGPCLRSNNASKSNEKPITKKARIS